MKTVIKLILLVMLNAASPLCSNATLLMSAAELDAAYGKETSRNVSKDTYTVSIGYNVDLADGKGYIFVLVTLVGDSCREILYSKFNRSNEGIPFSESEISDYLKMAARRLGGDWTKVAPTKWECNFIGEKYIAGFPPVGVADSPRSSMLVLTQPKDFYTVGPSVNKASTTPAKRTSSKTLADWKVYCTKDAKVSSMLNEFGKPDTIDTTNGKTVYLWYNRLDYGANQNGILRVRVARYKDELIVVSVYDGYNELTETMPWAQKVL